MERALSLELVRRATGDRRRLPSASELQETLVDVELRLFFGGPEMDEALLETAWYLHAVAAADEASDLYPSHRQRAAFQLSAHIFDLASQVLLAESARDQDTDWPVVQKQILAAQIGYLRGDLHPNAIAMGRRLEKMPLNGRFDAAPTAFALAAAVSLLAMDKSAVFNISDRVRREIVEFLGPDGLDEVAATPLGPASYVVEACREITIYLTYANAGPRLDDAVRHLATAVGTLNDMVDIDAQWAGAHLLDLAQAWRVSSIWGALPDEVPVQAGEAMTSSDPPVLVLWPPQYSLLHGEPNPLLPQTRRLVLSLPTSAGKSLVAQLLATAHLVSGQGAICYVAPTHSLVREVRRSLRSRIGALGRRIADVETVWGVGVAVSHADVDVMTPERLAFMIRNDPASVLDRFGLFIIDEAHLLNERGRGWGLEATLSFLHSQTRESNHRIALLSSAIGNRPQITSWVSVEEGSTREFHDDWRGPRRIHAIFNADIDWDSREEVPPIGRQRKARAVYDLKGKIRVRTPGGGIKVASFVDAVGVRTRLIDGGVERQGSNSFSASESTPFYQCLVPLLKHLADAGPVLVVESTRDNASRLAKHTALAFETHEPAESLVEMAKLRLGVDHPLGEMLRAGVAFHHAGLPRDLQDAIENGVRVGQIRVLVSTTTLTEGVNLPVRSVVIASQGSSSGTPYIVGPKLLNAIGRAGRAGKETEGWIVLAQNGRFESSLFDQFLRDDAELRITSRLCTDEAVELLAAYEETLRMREDAVFDLAADAATDFVAYVWMLSSLLSAAPSEAGFEVVMSVIEGTLAWEQAEPEHRRNLRDISAHAFNAYWRTPEHQRERWARSGASIGSSRLLQELADQYIGWLARESTIDLQVALEAVDSLVRSGIVVRLLDLPEAEGLMRSWPRLRRNAGADDAVEFDIGMMLLDWVKGASLQELGERYLSAIEDHEYRSERLSIFITAAFENYLPWMLGTLIVWVNDALTREHELEEFPQKVVGYVEWGVGSEQARILMAGGVRSRTAANRIGESAVEEGLEPSDVAAWIGSMPVSTLVTRFELSSPELEDVLALAGFSTDPSLALLLSGDPWLVPVDAAVDLSDFSHVEFSEVVEGYPKGSILIVEPGSGAVIAQVPTPYVSGVRDLLLSGLPYLATVFDADLPVQGIRVLLVEASDL